MKFVDVPFCVPLGRHGSPSWKIDPDTDYFLGSLRSRGFGLTGVPLDEACDSQEERFCAKLSGFISLG